VGETVALCSAIDPFHTSSSVLGRTTSSSPVSRFEVASYAFTVSRPFRMVIMALALCCAILLPGHVCAQAPASGHGGASAPSLMDKPADVVVFVKPLSADTASIGIAYSKIIKHESVKDDLRRLLNATGWGYRGDLLIDDGSSHPEDVKDYPVTTGAMLTVMRAPQVRDGAPELLPYLQAFQAFTHVEVNFALPDLTPYKGVQRFESKALAVELYKDQGVYRFETEIRDHNNALPALTAAATNARSETPETPAAVSAPKAGSARANWILGGVALIGGLIVALAVYALLARREPRSSVPMRSPQRR
jgi:hypothetical protein